MIQRIQNMNNKLMAILVLIGILILAYFMNQTGDQSLVYIWFIGCFVGFVLQRSRFCFASAFRDLFLFGTSKTLKGILIGLLVATIGFVIIMSKEIPFPSFGGIPGQAHILPLGLSTIVGGISFGNLSINNFSGALRIPLGLLITLVSELTCSSKCIEEM